MGTLQSGAGEPGTHRASRVLCGLTWGRAWFWLLQASGQGVPGSPLTRQPARAVHQTRFTGEEAEAAAGK